MVRHKNDWFLLTALLKGAIDVQDVSLAKSSVNFLINEMGYTILV